jgi:lactoylglutathione lyase
MRFGYTILYVSDVASSLEFYERALGQRRRFLHESGQYAELDTGDTALAFAAHEPCRGYSAGRRARAPGRLSRCAA